MPLCHVKITETLASLKYFWEIFVFHRGTQISRSAFPTDSRRTWEYKSSCWSAPFVIHKRINICEFILQGWAVHVLWHLSWCQWFSMHTAFDIWYNSWNMCNEWDHCTYWHFMSPIWMVVASTYFDHPISFPITKFFEILKWAHRYYALAEWKIINSIIRFISYEYKQISTFRNKHPYVFMFAKFYYRASEKISAKIFCISRLPHPLPLNARATTSTESPYSLLWCILPWPFSLAMRH
jgi:hypothetical protein